MFDEVEKKLLSPKKRKVPKTVSISEEAWYRLLKYCRKTGPGLTPSGIVSALVEAFLDDRGFK